jgi:hypothetical protein
MINWATIIENVVDVIGAFLHQNPEYFEKSVERLIMNASTEVLVNMQVHVYSSLLGNPEPAMKIAPPTIGEPLNIEELRQSTILEEKYRFTTEGSFVRD